MLVFIFVMNFIFATNFVAEATAINYEAPYALKETDVNNKGVKAECAKQLWPRQIPMRQLRKSLALQIWFLKMQSSDRKTLDFHCRTSSASDFIDISFDC